MFTNQELTQEKAHAWLDALESEKEAMAARIARAKEGRPDPVNASLEVLEGRAKDIDAEIKRVEGLAGVFEVSEDEAKPSRSRSSRSRSSKKQEPAAA